MTTHAEEIIAALRSGHDDLAALVRKLDPADLERPSGASEWQVSQVLSHLGSGAEIGLAALTAGLTGAPRPDGDFNRQVWARWDAMAPAQHADGFLDANERLVEAYESLEPATREQLRINLGFLPEPVDVATTARFRLSEFALHQWDVAVSAHPDAVVAPLSVPLLLGHVGSILGWIGKPEAYAGEPVTLAVRLRDPDQSHGLQLGDRVELTDTPEHPDGELTAPAEAWLRLVTGRLAPHHTPDSVRVTGPVSLDDLRRVFPGF